MHQYHHSGDSRVKLRSLHFHQCGDGNAITNPVKCVVMKHPNRIRELRKQRGLSQQFLAERIHTSVQQISRLERSQRRLSDHWMALIAPELGVEPWELIQRTGANSPSEDTSHIGENIKKDADEFMRIYLSLDPERKARLKADALDLQTAQKANALLREEFDDSQE